MQENDEVADFLRDFVRDDRGRGDHTELGALQKRRRDQDAVDEVVETVADDDHEPAAAAAARVGVMVVGLAVLDMAMPPQHELLQNEEREDTCEHRGKQRLNVPGAADRVREDLQEDRAEQSTDCKAHERRHPACGRGKGEHRGDGDADHATRDGRRGDPSNRRHATRLPPAR